MVENKMQNKTAQFYGGEKKKGKYIKLTRYYDREANS